MNKVSASYLTCALLCCCVLLGTGCTDQLAGPAASDVTVAGKAGEVKLEGRLRATFADPLASGKAKFEMRSDRTRFSTEVQDVSTAGRGTVHLSRGGAVMLHEAITIALGFGDLNRDTRDGDAVPELAAGDLVEVFNADGALILSGLLH